MEVMVLVGKGAKTNGKGHPLSLGGLVVHLVDEELDHPWIPS